MKNEGWKRKGESVRGASEWESSEDGGGRGGGR